MPSGSKVTHLVQLTLSESIIGAIGLDVASRGFKSHRGQKFVRTTDSSESGRSFV